jgi:hypothetical protein
MAKTVELFSGEQLVCARCEVADRVWTRFRGLMGRHELAANSGLLLRPSGSVHTCFMRFPIDVIFLSEELEVLAVEPAVRPWRLRAKRGARGVLELPAGAAARAELEPGDRLTLGGRSNMKKEPEHAVC